MNDEVADRLLALIFGIMVFTLFLKTCEADVSKRCYEQTKNKECWEKK